MLVVRLIFTSVAALLLIACSDAGGSGKTHSGDMVLALSWQPGFCETRPKLPECRSQHAGRFDTTHFALHGLWPQPGRNQYCGVTEGEVALDKARRWKELEAFKLSDGVEQELFEVMPGARSYLHRHEWVKHGTCYAAEAETYFRDSLALMDVINRSPVRALFATSIGRPLNNREIRAAFDEAFGEGVGERVRVACKRDGNRTVITELTLGLSGALADAISKQDATGRPQIDAAEFARLVLASPQTKPGCPQGIVDAAGLQ